MVEDSNTAPYLVVEPEEKYYISLEPGTSQIINLGIINDKEADKVTQVFICENCSKEKAPLKYSLKLNSILVPSETHEGVYRV